MSQVSLFRKIEKTKNLKDLTDTRNFSTEELLSAFRVRPEVVESRVEQLIESRVLRKYNLTTLTLRILFVLQLRSELQQSEISEIVYTTPANVSQRLSHLIKQGMVSVRQDEEDRRVRLVSLTSTGRQVMNLALKDIAKFKQQWLEEFNRKELIIVMRFYEKLSRLIDRLEEEEIT